MTKEKLYKQLCECGITDGSPLACAVRHEFSKFFDSNVCIPKGENRHPYADVLHAYAEGIECEMKGNDSNTWLSLLFSESFVYRIKPSEPTCEYQYVFYDKDKEIARSSFLTEHEYDISCLSFEWLIDIKSKRVRRSE